MNKSKTKSGFSLIELLTVLGIIVFIASISFLTLSASRRKTNFEQVRVRISTLLSDAQSRSVNQENGLAWGVHFDNSASGAFYALFSGAYSSSAEKGHYVLPSDVRYSTSSISIGSSKNIMFKPVSGAASSSDSVAVELVTPPFTSSTINVSPSGVISY